MDEADYQGILARLPRKGYDPDKLITSDHPASAQ
jgi:hypothetical protein